MVSVLKYTVYCYWLIDNKVEEHEKEKRKLDSGVISAHIFSSNGDDSTWFEIFLSNRKGTYSLSQWAP